MGKRDRIIIPANITIPANIRVKRTLIQRMPIANWLSTTWRNSGCLVRPFMLMAWIIYLFMVIPVLIDLAIGLSRPKYKDIRNF